MKEKDSRGTGNLIESLFKSCTFDTITLSEKNRQEYNMAGSSHCRRIYRRAPIIEALVQFQFIPNTAFDFRSLTTAVRNPFSKLYPKTRRLVHQDVQINVDRLARPAVASKEILKLTSKDEKNNLYLRPDSFTFSELGTYDRWEAFVQRVQESFNVFLDNTPNRIINRVAVRFINRFDFPGPAVELSEYLVVHPLSPHGFKMKGFNMQTILDLGDEKSHMIMRQALVAPPNPEVISVLLDLDLFDISERPVSDEIWVVLEALHTKLDQVFEGCITDKTRALIS